MRKLTHRAGVSYVSLVSLVALVALSSCTSATSIALDDVATPTPDEELDASASVGPNGAAEAPPCPTDQPALKSQCVEEGLVCAYGIAADPTCDTALECIGEQWSLRSSGSCDAVCPDAFDDIVPGAACSSIYAGPCSYVDATCGCVPDDPDAGAPDAGDAGDGGALDGHWVCVTPSAGCPAKRPGLGSACVREITCDYGSCAFGEALAFSCSGGAWRYASASDTPCF